MKRLLAYLFIVLGLGLTFNVNAEAKINLCKKNKFTNKDYDFKLYMLKELGDMLYPLNYWDNPEKKLEEWQKKVLLFIKKNKSQTCWRVSF